jgi:hypothetical protein
MVKKVTKRIGDGDGILTIGENEDSTSVEIYIGDLETYEEFRKVAETLRMAFSGSISKKEYLDLPKDYREILRKANRSLDTLYDWENDPDNFKEVEVNTNG